VGANDLRATVFVPVLKLVFVALSLFCLGLC
jgi:hypothetical protein